MPNLLQFYLVFVDFSVAMTTEFYKNEKCLIWFPPTVDLNLMSQQTCVPTLAFLGFSLQAALLCREHVLKNSCYHISSRNPEEEKNCSNRLYIIGPEEEEQEVEAHHTILFGDGDCVKVQNKVILFFCVNTYCTITAISPQSSEASHFVLIAGDPIGEPVAQHGMLQSYFLHFSPLHTGKKQFCRNH